MLMGSFCIPHVSGLHKRVHVQDDLSSHVEALFVWRNVVSIKDKRCAYIIEADVPNLEVTKLSLTASQRSGSVLLAGTAMAS